MTDAHIDDEALGWAIRMAEPDADWDAFLAWLEADTTRSGRYDRAVAMLDDAAVAAAAAGAGAAMAPASVEVVARPARRPWIGGAIAATLAGAIGLGVWTQAPQPYAIATAAGEQRTVLLADHSKLDRQSLVPVCALDAIDLLITDRRASVRLGPYRTLIRNIEAH